MSLLAPGGLPAGLDTPALVVDEARLEANLARTADTMRRAGVALRPHAKTHKSVEVARRQRAHGAAGLTVATLGEADVFADAGVDDLFVAYPLYASAAKAPRLRALAERVALRVGVDSAGGAAALGDACPGLAVCVEVDSGHHRTGVAPADVVGVADAARRAGLRVAGVFTFGGHGYAPDMPPGAGADERDALAGAAAHLTEAGYDLAVVSAGSTPTATYSARPPVTEERPGIYPFYDAQQLALGSCTVDDVALVVAATVVSVGADGRRVLDAGSKVLGADRPAWVRGHGLLPAYPDVTPAWLGEHHGVVDVPDGAVAPALGEVVALVPNHVCQVVNLADEYTVVRDGGHVGTWPVDARARNR
jgi:D-serine deaminase-like pyridoxal phosphate-dependent protein